ncbi:MAG TPA: outer membrane beta-barrel protein [Cryomorphaceae bacterium]|nr:outer membrane beta-barrel protein [Cryomorphaceae bacterium]
MAVINNQHRVFVFLFTALVVVMINGPSVYSQTPISFGVQGSMNFSFRIMNPDDGSEVTKEQITYTESRETAGIGYRAAFVGNVGLSDSWTLEAGVSYIENTYNFKEAALQQDGSDPSSGVLPELRPDIIRYELQSTYRYTGIPIRMIWNVGTENIKFLAHIGVSPQFLVEGEQTEERTRDDQVIEIEITDTTEELEDFNVTPFMGFGAEFRLNKVLSLRLEGVARYGALNVMKSGPIESRLYSSEFNAGLYCRIN